MATLDQWMDAVQEFTEATNTNIDMLVAECKVIKEVCAELAKRIDSCQDHILGIETKLHRKEWIRPHASHDYAACTCGAGDAEPPEHDENCPAYIPF